MSGMVVDIESLRSKTVLVTPDMAFEWLSGKALNRNIRDAKVQEYASDMKAGRWRLTHQGIAFDEDGKLIDGQHRLWAITQAGVPIKMMVTYGLPADSILVVDAGIPRTLSDGIRLQDPESGVGTLHVAVARSMMFSTKQGSRSPSRSEVKQFLDKHWTAVGFAVDAFGKKKMRGITVAPVVAVAARSFYTVEHEKIIRFVEVLKTGIADPETESIAVKLRNWLLEVRTGTRAVGKTDGNKADQYYGKTARALAGFVRGEKVGQLYPASEELFPLPEEQPKKRKKGA